MAYNINDTVTMLAAMKHTFPPSTFLLDTFFPNVLPPFTTSEVDMEYKKGGRKMAPFATPGARGLNSARSKSVIRRYKPPMLKNRRPITLEDIQGRSFGETIYSEMTPEERGIRQRAEDLAELQEEHIRRLEWEAAQILNFGEFEARGYADDGKEEIVDTITYDGWGQKLILSGTDTWDHADANIYDTIDEAAQKVAQATGSLPGIMVLGKNGLPCMLNNESMYKKLLVPNAENLKLMSFAPRYETPEVRYCGRIVSMNLDIYQYFGSYEEKNENGIYVNKPFIPDNAAILGVPGRGRQLYGAITLVKDKKHVTFSARFVPNVTGDEETNETALSLYSRPILVPEYIDDWYTIQFK